MLDAIVGTVLLGVGAVLLTVGAEMFAENVGAAASRLGVSVLAVGVLLAGAEPEEAVTAVVASGRGHPALAAGDAIGANLVILTLTLGLAALVTRLPVSRRVVEYAVAASVAGALTAAFLWNGVMGRLEGVLLVLAYAAGVAWVWRREQEPPPIGEIAELEEARHEAADRRPDQPADRPPGRSADRPADSSAGVSAGGRPLLLLLGGLLGMVVGGFLAVSGAQGLVGLAGLTESVIGLTALALATSAEMLALVWASARRGVSEVVVAGAVGSVAYNATISIGLAAWVSPLAVGQRSPVLGVALVTAVLPLLLLAGRRTGTFPRWLGAVLVLAYPVAVAWLFAR
ncbi:MAG TPA: hypothetical protein VLA97_00690 [Nocardioidaceae bacterium]|nr:hypothetical protein [Nocardioidaceae bacterium]